MRVFNVRYGLSSLAVFLIGWKGSTSGGKGTGAARLAQRTTSRGATLVSSALQRRGWTTRRSRGACCENES
jgi:hypothetical protein